MIDSNPHAEIPIVRWQSDPREFASECIRRADAGEDLYTILGAPFTAVAEAGAMAFEESAVPCLKVAEYLGEFYGRNKGFVQVGPFRFPPTPEGIGALRVLRKHAPGIVRGPVSGFADKGSRFAAVAGALEGASTLGILDRITNATKATDCKLANPAGYVQFGIGVHLTPSLGAQLPALVGSRVRSILAPNVEGYEFNGSDIDSWMESTGACMDGTIEFLDRIGVEVDRTGGVCECGECGSESGDEDGVEIESCDDFTLDERTVRMLDKAGYLESTVEWIRAQDGADGSADDWEELDEQTAAEIVAEFGPGTVDGATTGVVYDTNVWTFEPTPETMEGLDDIEEGGVLLSLGRKLGALSDAHSAVGSLPPIDGRLTPVGPSHGSYDAERVELRWDSESGILEATLGARAKYRIDTSTGARAVRLNLEEGSVRFEEFFLDADGSIALPRDAAGESAALFLALACGRVGL